jgi:methylmalonyl-CoA mutase N-terminal domain/subunit
METGYVQREMAYDSQQSVKRHERIVVIVNCFSARIMNPFPFGAWIRHRTGADRMRARTRAAVGAAKAIAEVELRARSGENLMPAIVAAVEAYATLGEISDALRRVFGEHWKRRQPSVFLLPIRKVK